MKAEIELLPPVMPNFIRMAKCNVKLKDLISVSDLSEDEANEYAELMKQEFIKHWKSKASK